MKRHKNAQIWLSLIAVMLTLLTACGGGTSNEAAEDTSSTDTSAVSDATESEAIENSGAKATGSEEDSGELPPTPDSGSKVVAQRATPNVIASSDTAVSTQVSPANRSNPAPTTTARQLDLVLLVDATGSMAEELGTLQAELDDLLANLAALPDNITLRYGFVVYRDGEKSDSIQLFSLTNHGSLFAENFMTITAVGGGDYPENLNGGLYQAVTNMNWNPEADRLLILLGDAPPRMEAAEPTPYGETLSLAAEQNITIFTLGSDGLNPAGVEIFQQIAETRNGRFVFLSRDPEHSKVNVSSIQPITNLTNVLVEIVLEVLHEEPS